MTDKQKRVLFYLSFIMGAALCLLPIMGARVGDYYPLKSFLLWHIPSFLMMLLMMKFFTQKPLFFGWMTSLYVSLFLVILPSDTVRPGVTVVNANGDISHVLESRLYPAFVGARYKIIRGTNGSEFEVMIHSCEEHGQCIYKANFTYTVTTSFILDTMFQSTSDHFSLTTDDLLEDALREAVPQTTEQLEDAICAKFVANYNTWYKPLEPLEVNHCYRYIRFEASLELTPLETP